MLIFHSKMIYNVSTSNFNNNKTFNFFFFFAIYFSLGFKYWLFVAAADKSWMVYLWIKCCELYLKDLLFLFENRFTKVEGDTHGVGEGWQCGVVGREFYFLVHSLNARSSQSLADVRPGTYSFSWISHVGAGAPGPGPSSSALSGALAGSWVPSGTAGLTQVQV